MNINFAGIQDPPISTGFFTDRNEKNQSVNDNVPEVEQACKEEIAVAHKTTFIKSMNFGKIGEIYQIGMNILSNAGSSLCELGTLFLKKFKGIKLKVLNISLTINFIYKQVPKESKEEYTNKHQSCRKSEGDILTKKRSSSLPTTNTNPIPC